jgi:hypothetical protein
VACVWRPVRFGRQQVAKGVGMHGLPHQQALRHVAAYALGQLHPQHRLNLRADPDAQQAVLARMGLNA